MEYIILVLFGIFIGVSVAGYMFTTEINRKERKLANQKAMIKNRDILIANQCNKIQLIKNEISKPQFGSVENLQNKIKSVLFNEIGNRK